MRIGLNIVEPVENPGGRFSDQILEYTEVVVFLKIFDKITRQALFLNKAGHRVDPPSMTQIEPVEAL
ncbi:hypothetical protein KKF45_05595 [Patescibacteria group bacterium]|nr:hypothetical protein [Patescibacteria group bacterium]